MVEGLCALTGERRCENPTHSHGSGCYRTCKCRCDVCRAYNREYSGKYQRERNMLLGKDVWMPSWPSTLRLRALASVGWSPNALAERYSTHSRRLEIIRRAERPAVRRHTHRLVKRMYDDLWDVHPEGKSASQARAFAQKNGWPMPLELDDSRLEGKR